MQEPKPRYARRGLMFWLATYVLVLVGIVALVLQMRSTALREMDTPEAHAQWQKWRESKPNQDTSGPVKRRPPKADEPPALMLLRDHFAVVMTGAVLFGSLLFGTIMIAFWGAFATAPPPDTREQRR